MTTNSLYLSLQSRRNAWIIRAWASTGASAAHAWAMVQGFNARMTQILCGK